MELIEHLECLKEELHKLIAISEEGAVAHDESLRHDVKIRYGRAVRNIAKYADKLGAR